jgi:hypothetical protein
MISYSDLEFAIERWKARAAGVPQPAAPAPSGAVEVPMPVPTAPEDPSEGQDSAYVAAEVGENPSGLVIADGMVDPPADEPVE